MITKKILRIIFGLVVFPTPLILGTIIWIFTDDDTSWKEVVGKPVWYLISGQWKELPD